MNFRTVARGIVIGTVLLLGAACTASTSHQVAPGDNGAFCSGSPVNKQSCEDNQRRM
jgi:hypothetical protein